MIGTIVDQYKIVARIAGGGMGEVYRAIDLELERDVAIKCVRPELSDLEEATKRFRAEARTLAKLAHLNIATVYRFFTEDDRLFLVMEYIDGKPFGEIIAGSGSIPHAQAVRLVQDALKGLGYAHKNNIVHRDIKPGNLMVDTENTVKVLDFGIAHLVGGTRLTRVGSVVGTPAYMAPEQILGKSIDPRTDLYSLGVVLYEMLSGKLPYAANSDFELMRAHLEEVPRPMSELSKNDVPKALQNTVERALAKDSGDRFQSAEEFAAALDDAEQHRTVFSGAPAMPAAELAETTPVQRPSGGTTVLVTDAAPVWKKYQPAAIAAGAVTIVLLLALIFWPKSKDTPMSTPAQNQPAVIEGTVASNSEDSRVGIDAAVPVNANDAVQNDLQSAAELSTTTPAAQVNPTTANPTTPIAKINSTNGDAAANSRITTPPVSNRTNSASATTAPANTRSSPTNVSVATPSAKISVVKVAVHENQGTGRFSRDAGYNGAFRLNVPMGANRNVVIDEVAQVYRDGVMVSEQVVNTETRLPGTFKSKQRIEGLKTLEPGEYEVRLLFNHEGKTLGEHKWKLTVNG